jgi:hypothetical protein
MLLTNWTVFSLVGIKFSPFEENQGGNSNQISEILFYPAISGNKFVRDFYIKEVLMKKILFSIAAVGMLAGCGSDGNDAGQEGPPETEVKTEENPVTVDYLQERFTEGMAVDAYAVEIQTWVDKGQAEIQETVKPPGQENLSADIIQVADGFLAVAYDSKQITFVKPFASPEEAKKYIEENL